MSSLRIHASPKEDMGDNEIAMEFALQDHAEVPPGRLFDDITWEGPSHLASGDAWLDGDELSYDWLVSSGNGAMEWCVPMDNALAGPVLLGLVSPQSPTGVDCLSALSPRSDAERSDVGHGELACRERRFPAAAYMESIEDKTMFAVEERVRDLRLQDRSDSASDDDAKVQLSHANWVGGDMKHEEQRRRQRGYEKKYRRKRRSQFKILRDEWAATEVKLYDTMQKRAHPYSYMKHEGRPNRPAHEQPSPSELLWEEHALMLDRIALLSVIQWQQVFDHRNYSRSPTLYTREQYAQIERQILGPSIMKPCRPLRFKFEWD